MCRRAHRKGREDALTARGKAKAPVFGRVTAAPCSPAVAFGSDRQTGAEAAQVLFRFWLFRGTVPHFVVAGLDDKKYKSAPVFYPNTRLKITSTFLKWKERSNSGSSSCTGNAAETSGSAFNSSNSGPSPFQVRMALRCTRR